MSPRELAIEAGRRAREAVTRSALQKRRRDTEAKRAAYGLRKYLGICVECGQRDAIPGKIYCADCRLYRNQWRSGAKI